VSKGYGAKTRGGDDPRPVAVLGMGNVLLGDDAVGPTVVETLRVWYELPDEVECADIGTPGLDLVPHMAGRRAVILVDAVAAAGPPGTVRVWDRERIASAAVTGRLSPHDPGLAETLAALEFSGEAPEVLHVVGIVPAETGTGLGLSPAVREAVPEAVETVVRLLVELGVPVRRRPDPGPVEAWWSDTTHRGP